MKYLFSTITFMLICLTTLFLAMCGVKNTGIEKINGIRFINIKDSILQTEVNLTIKNETSLNVTVNSYEANVFMNGSLIGISKGNVPFRLKKNDTTSVISRADLLKNNFFENLPRNFIDTTVDLKVEGKFYLNNGLVLKKTISSDIGLEEQVQVILKDLLSDESITVIGKSISGIGFNSITVETEVLIKNTLPFSYSVKQCDFNVFINNDDLEPIGTWESTDLIHLMPNGKRILLGEIKIKGTTLFNNAIDLIKKKNLFVKGHAEIDVIGNIFNIPIQQNIVFY